MGTPYTWIPAVWIAILLNVTVSGNNFLPDYKKHPCIRECEDGAPPMTCVYNFTLEYYYVLSKACFNCPYNYTDCFRPHCVAADGVSRAIMTVNRMMPGPAIHVCLNDMIIVNVYNMFDGGEGTAIHWHGIFQKDSQHQDGATMITQCPIIQYSSFEYRKSWNTLLACTYWHSHSYGALIIREPRSRDPSSSLYEHDLQEHVLIATDWMHEMTTLKITAAIQAGIRLKPPDILINGRGAYQGFTDPSTNRTIHTPYSVFHVKKDQKYRFRVINNGIMSCPIQISVDNHELILIASDGVPFEPVVVSSLIINPGERFDFVLDADKAVGNYWIRVWGLEDCTRLSANQVAILRYEAAPQEEPTQPTGYDNGKRQGKLLGLVDKKSGVDAIDVSMLNSTLADPPNLKQVPDQTFHLNLGMYIKDNAGTSVVKAQVNRINNLLPPSPLLTEFRDIPKELFCGPRHNISHCTEEFCTCTHLLKIDLGATVEIVLISDGTFQAPSSHPMHMHGQHFRVVAMDKIGESTSLEEFLTLDSNGMVYRNLDTPVAKDTVPVPVGGYTIIRFLADIPGFWHFHCHATLHNFVGMGAVLQVGTLDQMPRPPRHFPRCGGWRYGEKEETTPIPQQCSSRGADNNHFIGWKRALTLITAFLALKCVI